MALATLTRVVDSFVVCGTASSWHSMMNLIMSALQMRLHGLRFPVAKCGTEGPQDFHLLLI